MPNAVVNSLIRSGLMFYTSELKINYFSFVNFLDYRELLSIKLVFNLKMTEYSFFRQHKYNSRKR